MTCELRQWAIKNQYQDCSGRTTREHVLSKSEMRGLTKDEKYKARLDYAENVFPYIFLGETCLRHNSGNKCADTRGAKLYLFRIRYEDYPEVFFDAIRGMMELFTSPPPILNEVLSWEEENG